MVQNNIDIVLNVIVSRRMMVSGDADNLTSHIPVILGTWAIHYPYRARLLLDLAEILTKMDEYIIMKMKAVYEPTKKYKSEFRFST